MEMHKIPDKFCINEQFIKKSMVYYTWKSVFFFSYCIKYEKNIRTFLVDMNVKVNYVRKLNIIYCFLMCNDIDSFCFYVYIRQGQNILQSTISSSC